MFKSITAFFGFALLLFLCVAGTTALSAFGFHLVEKYNRWDLLEPAITIGLFVISGLVFLGILYVSAKLLKLLGKHSGLFGTSPFGVLISLGVTALLFKNALFSCITFPFHSIYLLIKVVRNTLGMIASRSAAGDTVDSLAGWMQQLQMMMQFFLGQFNESFMPLFSDLPWVSIIQALAFWAVAGVVLNAFITPKYADTSPGSGKPSVVMSFLYRLGINRLLLTVVIFASLYLCATCIIAIPWLTENKADVTEDEKMLGSIRQRAESFIETDTNAYVLKFRSIDSIMQYETAFNRLDSLLRAGDLSNELGVELESVRSKLSATRTQADQFQSTGLRNWSQSVQFAKKEKKQIQVTAEDYFKVRMFEWGKREKNRYLILLLGWLSERNEFIESQLAKKKIRLLEYDSRVLLKIINGTYEIERCREEVKLRIQKSGASLLVQNTDSLIDTGLHGGRTIPDREALIEGCRQALKNLYSWDVADYVGMDVFDNHQEDNWYQAHPPEPVDPADGMGIFSVLSGWLLKVRSFELTLITGMFGFGLLGACLSFFVIPERRSIFTTSTFWVGEAVLQGLSASIVVFLAVKGGLVIIAADATQPNAYLLFFICLAGAVFSFKVWEWARGWFEKIFKGETKTGTEGEPVPQTAGSGTPGAEAAVVAEEKKEGTV